MSDLSAFRVAAAAMRSREGFSGTFINFHGERGEWTIGSGDKKQIIDARRLVLGVSLTMVGWQKFEGSKPVYNSVGFIRDRHEPRSREELGDLDQNRWRNGVDPWKITYFLPALDPETRQHFMFVTSSSGGKDALASLQAAFCDHNDDLPAKPLHWPLVELARDCYVNSFGKTIYVPIFEIVDWLEPPANFQAVTPPPNTAVLKLVHKATDTDSGTGDARPEMNDEIPF